jgi:PleD family two-component response regulator
VLGLGIVHAGSPAGRLTASFGIAWWDPTKLHGNPPERLFSTVDRLLYHAKATGRNRVISAALEDQPL